MRNAIFYAASERFLPLLELNLSTLRSAFPEHPEIIIYHSGLSDGAIARLSVIPRLRLHRHIPSERELGPAVTIFNERYSDRNLSYYRFALWSEAFDEYDNVLHIDADALILKPLDALFNVNAFTIFRDRTEEGASIFVNPTKDPAAFEALRREDGLPEDFPIGNCGVFVHTRSDRTRESREQLLQTLERYRPFIRWADQSVINIWMRRRGLFPVDDSEYNYQCRLLEKTWRTAPLRNAAIVHVNNVHHALRAGLMRCAVYLKDKPSGWTLFHALNVIAARSMFLLRALNKIRRAGK
jgi:hypothetical protein